MKAGRENMLIFVVEYIKEKGYLPTIREICHGTRCRSTALVNIHLEAMRDADPVNYVDRSPRIIIVAGHQYVKKNIDKEETVRR